MSLISLFLGILPCMGFLLGYLNTNSFPKPLTDAEEQLYLSKMAAGDQAARDKLIEHNLRLVAHIVKKFDSTGIGKEDLISLGTIGLIKAINTFDTEKKIKVATYAARCIENEILMYIRSIKNSKNDCYLNDPIGQDKEGNEMTLNETLGSDPDEISEQVELEDDKRMLHEVLNVLTPKERYVIVYRYGIGQRDSKTQREIAKELGISRSYISRIEKKALNKLKAAMAKYNMDS